MKSVYGVDIQQDNVEEAKGRLFDMYIKQYPKAPAISGLIAAQILERNIVCGDFIKEWTDEITKKRAKKISRPKTAKENVQDKYNTGKRKSQWK